MDYQTSKYSEDTDIDEVETCNDKKHFIQTLMTDRISLYIEIQCTCMQTDILRHSYLLTTESMRRMPKARACKESIEYYCWQF